MAGRRLFLFLFVLALVESLSAYVSADSKPVTLRYAQNGAFGVISSFYADARTSPPSIEQIVSWNNFLYLTTRYLNGDQKLEVWNVRNPAAPFLVQSLDYGNLIVLPQNHYRFPRVNVFDDTILVRSNLRDSFYKANESGELVLQKTGDIGLEVCQFKNNEMSFQISSAGSFGVLFGRLFDPGEVDPLAEYGYEILNFANPQKPFVSSMVRSLDGPVYLSGTNISNHLNSLMQNVPGRIAVSNNRIFFEGRQALSDRYNDVFWKPYFRKLFDTDNLSQTVRSQINAIVEGQPLTEQWASAVERFFQDLQIEADATVRDRILSKYSADVKVETLLADYGLSAQMTLRAALKKVVEKHLRVELEQELSATLFSPLLSGWMDRLFRIPTNVTPEELKKTISDTLNEGLSEESVTEYFLYKFVAPLMDEGDLEWMEWTLDDLVEEVANSDAGEAITAVLAPSARIVNAAGFNEMMWLMVPDADEYALEKFPENCRELIEYALYKNGADLKHDGLAFMELFKLYQYHNGNEEFAHFERTFAQKLREIQTAVADAMVETLEPFLAAQSFVGTVQERIAKFSGTLSCREAVSLAITDALAVRLQRRGIDVDQRLDVFFKDHQLYLSLLDHYGLQDEDLARVEDLLRVLDSDLHEADTRVRDLWNEGKTYATHFEKAARQALVQQLHESWGELDLDNTLAEAFYQFSSNHMDLKWNFGDPMDDVLKKFVGSSMEEFPLFVEFLDLLKRVQDGDAISRWRFTLQAAKTTASLLQQEELAVTYEAVEQALEEAFHQAMSKAVKSLLLKYAFMMGSQMHGDHAKWVSATGGLDFEFDVNELTSLKPVRSDAFTWKDRMILFPREEWDYMHPRKMSMVLFDPAAPKDSLREIVFPDGWGTVDYVHACQGVFMIGGSQYVNNFPTTTGMFLALDEDDLRAYPIRGSEALGLATATGMLTVNHGAHLVLYGPGGVFLLPNPMQLADPAQAPDVKVRSWQRY